MSSFPSPLTLLIATATAIYHYERIEHQAVNIILSLYYHIYHSIHILIYSVKLISNCNSYFLLLSSVTVNFSNFNQSFQKALSKREFVQSQKSFEEQLPHVHFDKYFIETSYLNEKELYSFNFCKL